MRRALGFSFVELLAALIVLGLVLVPAMQALQGGLQAQRVNRDEVVSDYRLLSLTETVLAEPYSALLQAALGAANPSSYSDAAGTVDRRLVYISAFDADNADSDDNETTGTDDGILKILVEFEGRAGVLYSLRYNT